MKPEAIYDLTDPELMIQETECWLEGWNYHDRVAMPMTLFKRIKDLIPEETWLSVTREICRTLIGD